MQIMHNTLIFNVQYR